MKFKKSPINYTGGKYRLLPSLIPKFPKEINTFVDLFCGGCNVGLNVKANQYIFNDIQYPIIDMYTAFLKYDVDCVIEYIDGVISKYDLTNSRDGYFKLRNEYNINNNPIDLFILHAHAFNFMFRFNSKKEFNSACGVGTSNFNDSMRSNLIYFLNFIYTNNCKFKSINFTTFDYDILNVGDYVYCDPPYLISKATYQDGKRGFDGWSEEYDSQLYSILDILHDKGISFGLSNVIEHRGNKNNILIEWIEKSNYEVHYLNMSYSTANYRLKERNEHKTIEVFVTNYKKPNLQVFY